MYKKIIFLIALIFILTGCTPNHKNATENTNIILTPEQEQNIDLQTQVAEFRKLDLSLTVPGQFRAIPLLTNRIYAPVDGKVVNVFVEQGQTVNAGQPLLKIQSDSIGQIESELLQSIIQLNSQIKMSQSQLAFARHNYERENILLKENITSRVDWESAKTLMNKESANLAALTIQRSSMISVYQRRLLMYGADSQVIQRVIATNRIYPFIILRSHQNGVVIKRDANQDEFIAVNKELFDVADLSKIWLVGNLFEKDIPTINIGDAVSIKDGDANNVKGKIIYIAPTLDMATKTLEVRAEIENSNYKLKPNMFEEMSIKTGVDNVLAVPRAAIQKIGDTNLVYVLIAPHTYAEREVEIGIYNDDYIQVKSGVKEFETIVTKGSFSLLGESIKMIEANQ